MNASRCGAHRLWNGSFVACASGDRFMSTLGHPPIRATRAAVSEPCDGRARKSRSASGARFAEPGRFHLRIVALDAHLDGRPLVTVAAVVIRTPSARHSPSGILTISKRQRRSVSSISWRGARVTVSLP